MTDKQLTIKQENFCQKVIELSGRLSDAYREAYDAEQMTPESIKVEAHRLSTSPGVASRIAELRGEMLARHHTTVDSITYELEDSRRLAMEANNPSAAVSASMGKAKLHGLLVEKREVSTPQGVEFIMVAPKKEEKDQS